MLSYSSSKIRALSSQGPSGAVARSIVQLPETNNKVVVCTPDLSRYSGLEKFKGMYPDRFFNVGIAEQNLIGVACGLAGEGFKPFVSSYASFASTRALDQIKISMAYMNMPITVLGYGSGLSVGILGATHICIDDLAIFGALPNITILSPCDGLQVAKCIEAASEYDKPVYIRLTGGLKLDVTDREDYKFDIGENRVIKKGSDVVFFVIGSVISRVIQSVDLLEQEGISCSIVNIHTFKPFNQNIVDQFCDHKLFVTVEEHNKYGGLGSLISDLIVKNKMKVDLMKIAVDDYYPKAASYERLLDDAGFGVDSMYKKVKFLMQSK